VKSKTMVWTSCSAQREKKVDPQLEKHHFLEDGQRVYWATNVFAVPQLPTSAAAAKDNTKVT
jgi:hypothetical protein